MTNYKNKIFKLLELITCLLFIFVHTVSAQTDENILQNEQHPSKEFTHHLLVRPSLYHGSEKIQITASEDQLGLNHLDYLTISIPIDGDELILDLTLNKQLIPKGYFRKTQEKGAHKLLHPSVEEVNFCHYNGKVRNKLSSWVAMSTCNGLSGVVYDGDEMYYIEKKESGDNNEHILYKYSNLRKQNNKCDYEESQKARHKVNSYNKIKSKRAVPVVRGLYNKEPKYVELVLVVDNAKFKELDESITQTENYCKSIVNIMNRLYAPLDIFIALVGVVIWTEHDEIEFSSTNSDKTLSNFLHYRRTKLLINHPNDNAQLLTKFIFSNGVVGKALKGTICTYEYSGGINNDHSSVVGRTAHTVAHMLGHNFGMEHDTNNCTCPDDSCIMTTNATIAPPVHWSSCSLDAIKTAFTHGMDYCLRNKPNTLLNSPVCGNGFVESGEECDCGLPNYCNNTCCDATTCTLQKDASCATGECCDLKTCKLKIPGTVCRSAVSECDLPEYCTGESKYCPDNFYKMDTETCQDGRAFCYHGTCRTKDDQCRLLWGETGKSSDDFCYTMNVKGSRHGHCGYNKRNNSFVKCNEEDKFCGLLHCQHSSENLLFGLESVSVLSTSFINKNGSIIVCRTVSVDLGLDQVDPGLVPDGAKCGENKICLNQKCVSVGNLQENHSCPHNCYNNGWCNNLGHCHCKDGYLLPFCEHL